MASGRWWCAWAGNGAGGCLWGWWPAALLLTLSLPLFGLPGTILIGLIAAVPATRAMRVLARPPAETRRIVPAQAMSLLAFVLYAVGSGAGFLLGAMSSRACSPMVCGGQEPPVRWPAAWGLPR